MKVKIGDKIVNAEDEPIMIIFSNAEERLTVANHLKSMPDDNLKYCMFNESTASREEVKKFMKI
jgi:predicted NodU family carbamoyl transferase